MRICVFKEGEIKKVEDYLQKQAKKIEVLVLPFCMFEEINYKSEISGDTDCMRKVAALSNKTKGVVFIGGKYNLYGKEYTSCLTCEEGKILGVSDEIRNLKNKQIKVYKIKNKTYITVVGKDVYDKILIKTLLKYNPNFILFINKENKSPYYSSLITEIATNFPGIIVSLNKNEIMIYKDEKEIAFSKNEILDFLI